MAFALILIGLLMVVTGANDTFRPFGAQLKSDFTGDKSFVLYIVAIGAIGALGYISDFRRFSHYFMALILISLVLSNKGFFQNFSAAINSSPVAPTAGATAASSTGIPTTGLFGTNAPNVSSNTLLNLGPLGTIDKPTIDPSSSLGTFLEWWKKPLFGN